MGHYALDGPAGDDGFLSYDQLQGYTFADGTQPMAKAPFNLIGAEPGHAIGTSAAGAGVDTLTSNVGMGGIVFEGSDRLGDSAHASNYTIPGGVQIGIAKAGTKITKVATTVFASVHRHGVQRHPPEARQGLLRRGGEELSSGLGLCIVTSKKITRLSTKLPGTPGRGGAS